MIAARVLIERSLGSFSISNLLGNEPPRSSTSVTDTRINRARELLRGVRSSILIPSVPRQLDPCQRMESVSRGLMRFSAIPRLNTRLSRISSYWSPFSPVVLKHRERRRGCARWHGGLLLRYRAGIGLGSSRFAGALQESRPWHLGAASRSRPSGGVP